MTKPLSVLSKSAFILVFVCAALPAFAQHGGGGHGGGGGGFHGGGGGGGGFHGGGGFQGGGGSRSSGGGGFGGRSYSPRAGYAGPRSSPPYAGRPNGGFASRPGNQFSRAGNGFAGGNQRAGNSAPSSSTDGRWHSFGGPARGGETSGGSGPATSSGNFHVFSGNRAAGGSSGAVRSTFRARAARSGRNSSRGAQCHSSISIAFDPSQFIPWNGSSRSRFAFRFDAIRVARLRFFITHGRSRLFGRDELRNLRPAASRGLRIWLQRRSVRSRV